MITEKVILVEWGSNNYELIHCKINIIAENTADVPLYNVSAYRGMIFDALENVAPEMIYSFHKSGAVKPWSFSLIKMHKYEKSNRNGYYKIEKGTKGYFLFNTISLGLFKKILEIDKNNLLLHLNKLKLKITSIEYNNDTYQAIPEDFKTITIQLHTPTYFYRARTKERLSFSPETFLEFQLRKFQSLGILTEFNTEGLLPYVRILRKDTHEKFLSVTTQDRSGIVRIGGIVGFITFKISGDFETKEILWEIVRLSQFTGIGTRTSLGFGHNSISKII